MKWLTLLIFLLALSFTQAYAIDIHQAKNQGLIGEQANGYLGLVKNDSSQDVKQIVEDVNAKRKQKYKEIAEKNQTNLEEVQSIAGNIAMTKTKPGNYYKDQGKWVKK